MSEIVQLYKDEQKTTKVYPKTVATEVYIDENTTVASQLEQIVKKNSINNIIYAHELNILKSNLDNTPVLQSFIDSLEVDNNITLIFNEDSYTFKSTVYIGQKCRIKFKGNNTMFIADFDNAPLLHFTEDTTHTWLFDEISFTYKTKQDSTNTNAYLIKYTLSGNSFNGFFNFQFKNIGFYKAYMCLGCDINSNVKTPLWNFNLDNIHIGEITGGGFCFSTLNAVGTPNNVMTNIRCFNENGSNTLPFITCISELTVSNLDLESWKNEIINCYSANKIKFENIHIEHHYCGAYKNIFSCSNGNVNINNMSITIGLDSGGSVTIFTGNTNTNYFIENVDINAYNNPQDITIFGSGRFTFTSLVKGANIEYYRYYEDVNTHIITRLDKDFVYSKNNNITQFNATTFKNMTVVLEENVGANRPQMVYKSVADVNGTYKFICLGGYGTDAPWGTDYLKGDFIYNKNHKKGTSKGWVLLENANDTNLSWHPLENY